MSRILYSIILMGLFIYNIINIRDKKRKTKSDLFFYYFFILALLATLAYLIGYEGGKIFAYIKNS